LCASYALFSLAYLEITCWRTFASTMLRRLQQPLDNIIAETIFLLPLSVTIHLQPMIRVLFNMLFNFGCTPHSKSYGELLVKSIIYVAQFGLPLKSQGLCYESPLIGGVFDAGEKSAIEWHRVDFQFTACPLICRHRDQAKFCLY
jgi:hypothetical protein